MNLLYPKIEEAKGMVLGSPTYNYNVTSLMKTFIDRLYPYYNFTDDRPRGYSAGWQDREDVPAFSTLGNNPSLKILVSVWKP